MNNFWQNIMKAVTQIFVGIFNQVTPSISEDLKAMLVEKYKKALATPNPWDDFGVGLLLDILGVPRPPAEPPA